MVLTTIDVVTTTTSSEGTTGKKPPCTPPAQRHERRVGSIGSSGKKKKTVGRGGDEGTGADYGYYWSSGGNGIAGGSERAKKGDESGVVGGSNDGDGVGNTAGEHSGTTKTNGTKPPTPPAAAKPPPAPGSGLTSACTLVKSILDQVTLNDCPPDNEAASDEYNLAHHHHHYGLHLGSHVSHLAHGRLSPKRGGGQGPASSAAAPASVSQVGGGSASASAAGGSGIVAPIPAPVAAVGFAGPRQNQQYSRQRHVVPPVPGSAPSGAGGVHPMPPPTTAPATADGSAPAHQAMQQPSPNTTANLTSPASSLQISPVNTADNSSTTNSAAHQNLHSSPLSIENLHGAGSEEEEGSFLGLLRLQSSESGDGGGGGGGGGGVLDYVGGFLATPGKDGTSAAAAEHGGSPGSPGSSLRHSVEAGIDEVAPWNVSPAPAGGEENGTAAAAEERKQQEEMESKNVRDDDAALPQPPPPPAPLPGTASRPSATSASTPGAPSTVAAVQLRQQQSQQQQQPPRPAAPPPGSTMGNVSLAALCSRTLDTVAAAGRQSASTNGAPSAGAGAGAAANGTSPKRSGDDYNDDDREDDDDEDEEDEDDLLIGPPTLGRRGGGGDDLDLLDDCVRTIFAPSGEDDEEDDVGDGGDAPMAATGGNGEEGSAGKDKKGGNDDGEGGDAAAAATADDGQMLERERWAREALTSPHTGEGAAAGRPGTPTRPNATTDGDDGGGGGAAPAAAVPTQPPLPRPHQLRMFGSEYARHLSSTPFSPPPARGSGGGGGGGGGSSHGVVGGGGGRQFSSSSSSRPTRRKMKDRLGKFSGSGGGSSAPPPYISEGSIPLVQSASNLSAASVQTSKTGISVQSAHSAASSHVTAGSGGSGGGSPGARHPTDPRSLEYQADDVLTGAVTDIVVTHGSERPPRGYYRITQSSTGLDLSRLKRGPTRGRGRPGLPGNLGKKVVPVYLNVKKEPNWDRAVQRPCVTALAVIYPDRNEFVPPGFCVVRRYKGGGSGSGGDRKDREDGAGGGGGDGERSSSSGGGRRKSSSQDSGVGASSPTSGGGNASTVPANLNFGTSGERVYLCYRRSREGNPITGVLPLQPDRRESVPEGYTVLERTPRNFVADLNAGAGPALFLSFRQRLANLEVLRPLPLVLAVYYSNVEGESGGGRGGGDRMAASATDRTRGHISNGEVVWERSLRAYYCTGGTVVPSDVGRFHIMDRSTHPLLSPSSVTNRLSLIEASRSKKAGERVGAAGKAASPTSSDGSVASVSSSVSGRLCLPSPSGSAARKNAARAASSRGGGGNLSLGSGSFAASEYGGMTTSFDESSVVSNVTSASAHSFSRPNALSWNSSSLESSSLGRTDPTARYRDAGPEPRVKPSRDMPSPYSPRVGQDDDDDDDDGDDGTGSDLFGGGGSGSHHGGSGNANDRFRQVQTRTIFTHPDPTMQTCLNAMDFIPTVDCPALALGLSVPPPNFGSDSSRLLGSRYDKQYERAKTVQAAIVLLQARVAVLCPILTACYTHHGGSALMAVDGLTKLLNETDFFAQDVNLLPSNTPASPVADAQDGCSTRLTLLDLSVQVVCDVATSTSRETNFGSCVEFVSDAMRYSQGNLNTRTIGYVLRFYLFVFYFGASVPTVGSWPNDEGDQGVSEAAKKKSGSKGSSVGILEGLRDAMLLGEENDVGVENDGLGLGKKHGYLPGGAPQAAALALKDLVTLIVGRMRTMSLSDRQDIIAMAASDFNELRAAGAGIGPSPGASGGTESIGMFISDLMYDVIDGAMNRVEMTNYTQLALHQIHRSGGSELFWHDMMTSCGIGLFGQQPQQDGSTEAKLRYIVTFSVLASLVKVTSGKVRRVGQSADLVPRDVASKLLSLELLLHFLERWRDLATAENICRTAARSESWGRSCPSYDPHEDAPPIATMAYAIRRLVVPCLLSNTGSGLENRRVFRRIIRVVSEFWCNPYYRHHLKMELGVLIEHFFLKALRLGPQVLPPKRLKDLREKTPQSRHSNSSPLLEEFDASLLSQQIDVLIEIKRWFSSDPKDILELFLNFDIADTGHGGHVRTLPGPCWKVTQRLCEALCTLTEECGDIISEQIRATRISGASGVGGPTSSAAALSSAVVRDASPYDNFTEMTHVREGARVLQEKSFEAIGQIVKCFMQCAALTSDDRYQRIKARGRNGLVAASVTASSATAGERATRNHMSLTVDTVRNGAVDGAEEDDLPGASSVIEDDGDDTDGAKTSRLSVTVPTSPLRLPRSPMRPTVRNTNPSVLPPADEDIVEYWNTSLAERRKLASLSPGTEPHMGNFASPDIRITSAGKSANSGSSKIATGNANLPPLSPKPAKTPKAGNLQSGNSLKSSMEPTPDEKPPVSSPKMEAQKMEENLTVAFEIMSTKGLKKAIEYLVACNFITPSARDVASFLRLHQAQLNPEVLGEYLGEGGRDGGDVEYWNLIRFNYVRAISFVGMNVEQGLRHFLTSCGFRLPGEAQKIDRIISTFAQCYWEDNAGDHIRCPFTDQDTVFLISFAIIMLNTDLHSSGVSGVSGASRKQRKKMTKTEFLNNLRGVENSEDVSRDYLSAVYESIEAHPIEIYVPPGGIGSGSIRSSSTGKSSRLAFGTAPAVGVGSDNQNDLTFMIKSLIRSVKPAQELLRGVAVHKHPFLSISSYDQGGIEKESAIPKELVRTAIGATWHHFHGIVNATLETAHLDSKGLESCLDVLKYALCATICLDMPMERTAFITQLARVKFFKENRGLEEENAQGLIHDHQAYRKDDWYKKLETSFQDPSDDEAKDAAVQQVYEMIRELHASLQIDSKLRRDMNRVARRIRKGEMLLNDPSRSFVREGDLVKRCNRSGRSIKYHFFLFSDVLLYTHKSSSGDFKIHEELPLHLIKITDKFTGAARKTNRAFHIRHPRKSFMVFAADEETKLSWMQDISSAMKKDVERKARLEGARLASAAVER